MSLKTPKDYCTNMILSLLLLGQFYITDSNRFRIRSSHVVLKHSVLGTSLAVPWSGLCTLTATAEGGGSVPHWESCELCNVAKKMKFQSEMTLKKLSTSNFL